MAKQQKEMTTNKGLVILMVCGVIAVAMIIACVFFPDQIFGLFM